MTPKGIFGEAWLTRSLVRATCAVKFEESLPSRTTRTVSCPTHLALSRQRRRLQRPVRIREWAVSSGQEPVPTAGATTARVFTRRPAGVSSLTRQAREHLPHLDHLPSLHLLLHAPMLQTRRSSAGGQAAPPCCACETIARTRVCVPPPHVAVHEVHSSQALNLQSWGQGCDPHGTRASSGGHCMPCSEGGDCIVRTPLEEPGRPPRFVHFWEHADQVHSETMQSCASGASCFRKVNVSFHSAFSLATLAAQLLRSSLRAFSALSCSIILASRPAAMTPRSAKERDKSSEACTCRCSAACKRCPSVALCAVQSSFSLSCMT
mmetsp:Transcript_47471/g.133580  ORF Transcript_47471/g.133580 Transcript_47471/m.133580 type:complete len:321 (-) Transcript_47471:1075-2037(-)